MTIAILSAVVGLVVLLIAGDILVKGAVNLALRLGLPALVVSLTVVAFGTSAPELLISVQAILDGVPGLALGNVVGSNTANVLMVLGIPALIATLDTSKCDTRKEYGLMMFGTFVFIALCFTGVLTWWHGLILLALLAGILFKSFLDARAHMAAKDDTEVEGADPDLPWWRIILYLLIGLIGLPFGANLLIDGSLFIAREIGVSETVIGLTLVAIGTSLPELATTVMATLRRHADVALGNVIGSNMFNLLGIMGVASLVGPIPVDASFLTLDLWIMLGASLLLVPFVFLRKDISRIWGIALTALYATYLLLLF